MIKNRRKRGLWKVKANLTRKEKLVLILPVAAAILAVLTAVLLLDKSVTHQLDSGAVQYYANGTYSIGAETELVREGDESYYMTSGRGPEQELNNLPIYYEERRTVVLPRNMIYVEPRANLQQRADFFSEILCSENGIVRLLREKGETVLNQGFLYDGSDLYLFLEPVVLNVNGYALELQPMSYVEAVYGGNVMVFNYETKEQLMESPQGDVTAVAGGGDYTISLLGDSLTMHDGKKRLLFTRPDLLEPVEE